MQVSHGRSGQPSEQRTATFTGTVHMDPVLNAPGVMINTVIFTPGARTHWHRHPGGQLLVVTAGRGIVATRAADIADVADVADVQVVTSGDVVWAEPGEEHWHGACGDSLLTHMAVSHGTTEWAAKSPRATTPPRNRSPRRHNMSEQYEVLAVRYGTRQASAAEVFLNYHVYREPDRPLGMDYFFWVARNPARSVLIDTGFSPAGGAARGRTMLMDTVPALRAARDRAGRGHPHRLTHAHYDHIGGLPGLRRNRRRDPHDQGRVRLLDRADGPPRPVRAHHRGRGTGPPARVARGRAADPGRPDPPGRAGYRADPGRRAHPGPGHRHRGHGRRPVVLASDAVHYYEELERDRPFSIVASLADMYAASIRSASSPTAAPASSPGTTRWSPSGSATPPTRQA